MPGITSFSVYMHNRARTLRIYVIVNDEYSLELIDSRHFVKRIDLVDQSKKFNPLMEYIEKYGTELYRV
jgi:hypothetical protein